MEGESRWKAKKVKKKGKTKQTNTHKKKINRAKE
jgi:hypothetical protein